MTRRAVLVLLAACTAFVGVLAINTVRLRSRQLLPRAAAALPIDVEAAAARLGGAVRLQTVSFETPSDSSRAELLKLHRYLETSFPQVHTALSREVVGGYSLLYTWRGRDPGAKPILLMAHQDVVPVAPGTEGAWHVPPFSGEIRDGFVWGRGTWDDKGNLMAILEAIELLVSRGYQPERTVYLAFGHDEENGGTEGAQATTALLRSRGVHLAFVLDEGLLVADGMLAGLEPPAAVIGIAEKGSATLTVTAHGTAGHSSMPGGRSAIGVLATAIGRIESHPLPAAIRDPAAGLLDAVAPEMRLPNRVVLANRWLFDGPLRWQLERSVATNALVRTTTAVTIVRGGNKENVLPGEAYAKVNFRVLPGDDVAGVLAHVRRTLGGLAVRVEVDPGAAEPSAVSSTSSRGYRMIAQAVRDGFPGVIVAPGLMIGGTDSRHMAAIADDIYRFSPIRARPEDLARFHGTDERISVANYADLIRFYHRLILAAAGGD